MNKNSKKKNKFGNKGKQGEKKPQMKFTIDSNVYVPKIQEPMVECSICGQTIKEIADAISEPDGTFSHFNCVIKKISDSYELKPNQKVSYLGKGNFGIVENNEGVFTIVERIAYESPESYVAMKNFVESTKK